MASDLCSHKKWLMRLHIFFINLLISFCCSEFVRRALLSPAGPLNPRSGVFESGHCAEVRPRSHLKTTKNTLCNPLTWQQFDKERCHCAPHLSPFFHSRRPKTTRDKMCFLIREVTEIAVGQEIWPLVEESHCKDTVASCVFSAFTIAPNLNIEIKNCFLSLGFSFAKLQYGCKALTLSWGGFPDLSKNRCIATLYIAGENVVLWLDTEETILFYFFQVIKNTDQAFSTASKGKQKITNVFLVNIMGHILREWRLMCFTPVSGILLQSSHYLLSCSYKRHNLYLVWRGRVAAKLCARAAYETVNSSTGGVAAAAAMLSPR